MKSYDSTAFGATDASHPVRRSQLLTYIRLLDAAGEFAAASPRWIFACFHLNGAQTLAYAMPVHTPGSGSNGVTVSPSPVI